MTKNQVRAAAAVLALGSLATTLAACGGSSSGGGSDNAKATSGGTLYYYVDKPVEHTDPQRTYVGKDITNWTRLVYRQLVAFPISTDADVANKPVADLATDTGTSSNNAETWKFTLKDGVKWQDGKAVTCDDLKYGASRAFATDVITGGPNYILTYLDVPEGKDGLPEYTGPYKSSAAGKAAFDKAITCDGNTITYNFKKPWPDFPLAVASLHMMDPYRQDKDQGNKSNYQIVSNGPYKLQGAWDKEKGATLVRNPNYAKSTDSTKIRKALPSKIVFEFGIQAETIYDRLIADSGNDKYAVTSKSVPPAYYSRITGAVAKRTVNVKAPYMEYALPNFKKLTNVKVRQALAMATDQQGYIDAGGGSKAYGAAKSIVNPAVNGYKENPAFADIPEKGDAAAAKKLLQEAGVSIPYPITYTYPSSDTQDKQAAALKEGWDAAGFKTTLDGLGDTYYDVVQKPSNSADVIWGSWGADWPSAITVTPPLFDSRPNLSSASNGQDYGNYKSDAFNALVDKAQESADLNAQTTALQQADAQLGSDVAYIPLAVDKFYMTRGSKVTGYVVDPASSMYPDLGAIGVQQ
ncbi:ABC transporter substrate-binding protein [Nocardioides mangrovicus]|uniref:ABC transporter substrate-binding protein n=1 Tax=Nocardioides mangrovicus TaxID=2478913 RepID=A0A3L8P0X6_9ACTN|nr:ABC transporter substrate-binding protein [Nocardioides mangrovicus]RLV48542.1 ABC transporter substrate-binding protein [Nocardioides mangrovicus]